MNHVINLTGTEWSLLPLRVLVADKIKSGEWEEDDTFEIKRILTVDLPDFNLKKGDLISSFKKPLQVKSYMDV